MSQRRESWAVLLILSCLALLLLAPVGGQDKKKRSDEPPGRPLPDDKRLLALHLDFVKKAEKLAQEYETDKDWGRARDVYFEILKLVPQYAPARAKLDEMLQREANAKSAIVTVRADDGWQDTGIDLLPEKPVTLEATGNWVFQLKVTTNAEGVTIPKELRDFNPGCLVGVVQTRDPKEMRPFVVGGKREMLPKEGGRLLLRMYDTDPSDNSGALKVEVRGTFLQSK